MKQFTFTLKRSGMLSLLFIAMVAFIACGEEKRERPDVVKDVENPSQQQSDPISNDGNISQDINSNRNVGGDVQHYICPNDCDGSGGPAQGECPVCGTQYVHNAAYHDQGNQNQNQLNVEGGDQLKDLQQQQQQQRQNAPAKKNGEYHYICSAGCSGGAGSPGACSECGASLEHNTAYHN
ncbi:MAG: hypothetical protein GVX78_02505 [Bacteroidetes bacterium]|jgi:hypothetical protein|nr:hypothetical protein [Bacteroidota bacterium]